MLRQLNMSLQHQASLHTLYCIENGRRFVRWKILSYPNPSINASGQTNSLVRDVTGPVHSVVC